jgi:putative oxidoreductase
MKRGVVVARVLLGVIFTFFGSNMLFNFLKTPPLTGDVATMSQLMFSHKWTLVYGVVQVAAGLMLLFGRFVPLALTLLAGMIVNIVLFHITLNPSGIGPGLLAGLLELYLVYAYRQHFAGIFSANAKPA